MVVPGALWGLGAHGCSSAVLPLETQLCAWLVVTVLVRSGPGGVGAALVRRSTRSTLVGPAVAGCVRRAGVLGTGGPGKE
jgi:hypothetical protein